MKENFATSEVQAKGRVKIVKTNADGVVTYEHEDLI